MSPDAVAPVLEIDELSREVDRAPEENVAEKIPPDRANERTWLLPAGSERRAVRMQNSVRYVTRCLHARVCVLQNAVGFRVRFLPANPGGSEATMGGLRITHFRH